MSSGFYDRFETQHGKSRCKNSEIYVSGIPIDLDKAGFENIFIKAGTIESVRIIPPKIPNSTTTFGFVTYKHRTSAALAIETFNQFKFNGKTLTVRYSDNAQQSASTSSSTVRSSAFMTPAPSNSQINVDDIPNSTFIETPISIANKSLDVSKINMSTLIDSNIMNIDELQKRSSMGRGVFHQSRNQKVPVFNTMRPYARRLYQSRTHLSKTSIESDTSVSLIQQQQQQQQQQLQTPSVTNHLPIKSSNSANSFKQVTLTVGETYQINITHVNSPANFFIHLAASLSKKADFINNLDNYYRNDLSTNKKDDYEDDDDDINDVYDDDDDDCIAESLEVDDLCAGYLGSEEYWYRARIINKSFEKRTYHLSILDFGDVHELPFKHVKSLDQEFCDMDVGAIRCKLYNIEPASGREWCPSSIELLTSLQKTQDETLEVKVYSCDNYNQPETGRIEKIYAVDILFGGEDSVIEYMLYNNLAKNNQNLEGKFRFENDFPSVHLTQDFELAQGSSSQFGNDNDDDDEYNDHLISRSVSQANLCDTFLQDEHRRLTTFYTNPRERHGLFNCSFPVWKRRDLLGCVHSFKTGQTCEVIVSWIHDSQRFYIQEATKRFAQLNDLEESIGRYANVLLKDAELRTELFTYQNKSSKFDVVLVLYEAKWHRAIFLDKETRKDIFIAANLDSDSDFYDENYDEKFYFSFFLIDHGRNIYIVVQQNDPKTNLFILPLTSKLIQVGYFALKCSINEAYIKQRDSYIPHDCTEQLKHTALFERHFKRMLQGKQIQMRISQLNRFKDEDEAIVELFYTPEQVRTLLPTLLNVNELNSENVNAASLLVSSASNKKKRLKQLMDNKNNVVDLKTNCVYYVLLKTIAADENEQQQQKLVATSDKQEPLKAKDLNIPVTVPVTSTTTSKPPLPHSNKVTSNPTLIKAKKCAQLKLTKNEIYTVFLQHFDDSYQDQYFYLTLLDQASKMIELDNFIQLNKSANLIYIQALDDVKLDDYSLEALFDVDEKWYRVKATNIGKDSVDIFFLDYGNTQRLTESDIVKNKMLRRRIAYQDEKEAKLFSLEYQAVKCVHLVEKRFALKALLENLSSKTDLDTMGFDIIVNEIKNDVCSIQLFDITTPTTPNPKSPAKLASTAGYDETDNDDVFSDTNSITNQKLSMLADTNSEMSISLSVSTTLDGSIMHVVSTNEFYIQSQENLKQLIDHQRIIQILADLSVNMDFKSIRGQPAHQVGDICLAKYLCDSTWYRGVVMKVNVDQQLDEGYSYDVFFADYGNIESQMPDSLVLSMQCVRNAIKCSKKNSLENDLKSVVELPFMAICCQLDQRKECTRNTEILKTLMGDCPVFTFRVKQIKDHYLLNDNKQLKIKKYIINLYSNGKLLDENFETITQSTAPTPALAPKPTPAPVPALAPSLPIAKVETVCIPLNELKPFSCHEFKLAHLGSETEIYFNLNAHLDDLEAMQVQINADNEIISKSRTVNRFKLDDLVLAKFMNENNTYDWFRARIISINDSVYHVFYIDYGNVDDNLSIADLRPLPEKFMKQPQFAYKMRLNGIETLDLDAHDVIIGDYFLGEGFKLKVIRRQDDYYLVELWNKAMTECLNKILEPNYSIAIEKKQHQINSSFLNDKFTAAQSKSSSSSSLRVTTDYIYMEDFQRPLYFCLKENIEQRNLLSDRLNEHYNKSASISSKFHPKLNDYCAVLSEGSWFRAQIKSIDENKLHLFHIDYAYEETLETKDYNQTLRALSEEFMAEPRYIFGAYLLKPNSTECIQFNENEEAELADCLKDFFIDDDLKLDLIIQQQQTESVHFSNEFYFGVQILNSQNTSLNQIIVETKQEIERKKNQLKPALPDYIRLKSSDMPAQRQTLNPIKSDSYMLYSKHVDFFYIFEENQVFEMQRTVQAVCEKIMSERGQFSIEENSKDSLRYLPTKGDLVYAKYEDNAWYRCLVTNCNQSRNKYELFFVDFGNTELTSNEEILQGWTDEHMKPFRDVAPLSFKCKLYGLTTPMPHETFTDEQNAFFRKLTSDRPFSIKLIKFNAGENIFEICLRDSSQTSWLKFHEFLITNKIAQFKPVLKALHAELQTIESINEIEFYSELINSMQKA